MKRSPETRPTRWDGLVVLLVVLFAVTSAVTIWGGQGRTDRVTVVVSVDGAEADRYDLAKLPAEPLVYSNNGYTLHIGTGESGLQVLESDCPTQDCVHTGEIHRAGQSIVCLPARIIVELEGAAAEDGPDLVIG